MDQRRKTMSKNTSILLILIFYLALNMFIGIWASRKKSSRKFINNYFIV